MKKELLVIGAGNIGRGVIGGLFLNLVTICIFTILWKNG